MTEFVKGFTVIRITLISDCGEAPEVEDPAPVPPAPGAAAPVPPPASPALECRNGNVETTHGFFREAWRRSFRYAMPPAPFYRESDTINDLVNGLTTAQITPHALPGLMAAPLLVPLLVDAPG